MNTSMFILRQNGDAVFPITGPWGHDPEAHEFTEVPPTLLRYHHRGQQQPDIQGT